MQHKVRGKINRAAFGKVKGTWPTVCPKSFSCWYSENYFRIEVKFEMLAIYFICAVYRNSEPKKKKIRNFSVAADTHKLFLSPHRIFCWHSSECVGPTPFQTKCVAGCPNKEILVGINFGELHELRRIEVPRRIFFIYVCVSFAQSASIFFRIY